MIDPEIFFDNDAELVVSDLPTGLTVSWHLAISADSNTPVNVAVSGTLTETAGPPLTYRGVLEGAAITEHLTADQLYYLVIRSGQDLRVVGPTTCREVRLANA